MTYHFTSRRRAPRFFKQTEDPDVWIFGGEAFDFEYCRYGSEEGKIVFIDPVDGPFVSINTKFSDYCAVENDGVIKKITCTDRGIELHCSAV